MTSGEQRPCGYANPRAARPEQRRWSSCWPRWASPPSLLGPLLAEFAARLYPREHYVVRLLSRHQGVMMTASNRRRIRNLADVAQLRLRFVNRERGSGTRLLFDALLASQRFKPSEIVGYDREEFTHMATAATGRRRVRHRSCGAGAPAGIRRVGHQALLPRVPPQCAGAHRR